MHRASLILLLVIWAGIALPAQALAHTLGMSLPTITTGGAGTDGSATLHDGTMAHPGQGHDCCPESRTPGCPDAAMQQGACHGICAAALSVLVAAHPVIQGFPPLNAFGSAILPGAPLPPHSSNPLRPPA